MDKNLNNTVVIDGGEVKSADNGVVLGLGIVFGSPSDPDQSKERDFFTAKSFIQKKTSFDVPLYHNHGFPINRQIGEATLTKTDQGWSAEARIDLEDELGQQVYKSVKANAYGFSTGALSHLVEREAKENNTNFLSTWPVGELSLTPRPAERKAVVQAVKSIDSEGEAVFSPLWSAENEKLNSITVAIYDEKGTELWNIEKGGPLPISGKSIAIKDLGGSVEYRLFNYNDDGESGFSVHAQEWGEPSNLIPYLQGILARAAEAQLEEDAEDMADASDTSESEIVSLSPAGKSKNNKEDKNFESRVADIVKSMLKSTESQVSELEVQLQDAKDKLASAEQKTADSETNLTEANEKIARLEILAGAKEVIKNKGK